MAAGGKEPALVDALNYRGIIDYLDIGASRKGIADFAKKNGMTPSKLADAAFEFAVSRIKREVDDMLDEIRNRPVYTIHEMLEGKTISPAEDLCHGGAGPGVQGQPRGGVRRGSR